MTRALSPEFEDAVARLWPQHQREMRSFILNEPERATREVREAMVILQAQGWPDSGIAAAIIEVCRVLDIDLSRGIQA